MVDVEALTGAVLAALRTIPGITVYDGFVPKAVPETGGYPDPYIVFWAGIGDNPEEPLANGVQDTGSLIWDFQTTSAGADPSICRNVAQAAAAKLTNLKVGTGRVKPNPDGFKQQSPILDTQTTPARFMLPRPWRLNTN